MTGSAVRARCGFERASFNDEVAADVHAHGAPRDLDGFVAHYNRLVERRNKMIEQSFSMEAKLGEGAYATVVRAHRKPSSKESVLSKGPHGGVVALKLVQKSSLTDSVAANLENEIASWGAVRHVGVCELLGTFETPSLHVLAIELCEGGCLLDQLEDLKTFNEEHARQISRQLTNADPPPGSASSTATSSRRMCCAPTASRTCAATSSSATLASPAPSPSAAARSSRSWWARPSTSRPRWCGR